MNKSIAYAEYFYQKALNDTEALRKNVMEYPFCSFAAFLLLYHYRKTSHPDFLKLAQKTALLFNNHSWLQFQIYDKYDETIEEEIIAPKETGKENESTIPESHFIPEVETKLPEITEIFQSAELKTSTSELPPEFISESVSDEKQITGAEPEKNGEFTNREKTPDQQTIEKDIADKEVSPIEFEPLHTVDYFASLGIKIDEELVTNDKLSSQMKSFTEWLKSMKKVHPDKLEDQNSIPEKLSESHRIQNFAEESNINTEILTEAMAEVLIKQDKKEKAIEMFSKLSLINPAKSAYFAAKIESIKSS